MSLLPNAGPNLPDLYRLFRSDAPIPEHAVISGDEMPEPYHRLLVHAHHMTVTVEEFYKGPVNVRVLERRRDDDCYARKILLVTNDGRVVQFGIARVHLEFCSEPVRSAILEEKTPLGRVLIENNVLRVIQPTAYFRITPSSVLTGWFGLKAPTVTYGRLGLIYCDGRPAVELLEVLTPIGT